MYNTVNWKSQEKIGKIHYLCEYNRKSHEIIKEHFFSRIKVQNDILIVIIRIFFNSTIWNFIKISLKFWIMELKNPYNFR